MRAWQVHDHGDPAHALRLVETSAPEPGPRLLRVRVGAAAVGLPDVLMARGTYPLTPPSPFVPGQEVAGVVVAAGDATETEVGTRVMGVTGFRDGAGGLADEALVLDDFAVPVPGSMTDADAAGFLIPYHTAHLGLVRRGALVRGETLVVLGAAGGTGSAAIALGRALGATVVAVAGGDAKGAFCRRLGAEHTIDHLSVDVVGAVRELTGGRGADVVYDPVGGEMFDLACRFVASEGRVLTVGFAGGAWGTVSAADVTVRNYSVVGVFAGAYDRAFRAGVQRALLELWDAGALGSIVTRTVPFDEAPALLEELASRQVMGKAVVTVAPVVA
jgi:NADPH2:quinone reductase